MVIGVENILNAVQRTQLIALKSNAAALDKSQLRLASGLKVNSAIENPQSFFASVGLKNRAGDLSRLLDGIGQSIQLIRAAEDGLEGIEKILDLAEAFAQDVELKWLNGEITVDQELFTPPPDNVTPILVGGAGDFINYAGSQDSGAPVNVVADNEFSLTGNLWKRLAVNYTVTPDSVMTFEFRSNNIPEIAAIGFDNDNSFTNDNDRFFLFGTQTSGISFSEPVSTYQYDGSGDWVSVEIPIGTFFTGNFSHMTFINDDDSVPTGNSQYRNLSIREGDLPAEELRETGPRALERQYDGILRQLDEIAQDSSYRGTDLLTEDTQRVFFNEQRTSFLDLEGIDATSSGLDLSAADFSSLENTRLALEEIRAAREDVRAYASTLASELNVIQARSTFILQMIDTLETGSDKLTVADQNEEGAKLLALQTRQQIQISSFTTRTANIADFLT